MIHGLAQTLADWLSDVLPAAPSFWADAVDAFGRVLGTIPGPVLYFVPVRPVLAAGVAALTIILAIGALRFARRVLSLFTGGGGNA